MNKLKENSHLIIIVLLALLIIPIGYYFAYALPNYNKEKLNIDRQRQQDEINLKNEQVYTEKVKLETEAWEKENKETQLNNCLSDADITYRGNWTRACKSAADIDRESLKNCTTDFCRTLYKVDDSSDCSLTKVKADNVNEYLKNDKDECFLRYGN